jgi:hypothetical protein
MRSVFSFSKWAPILSTATILMGCSHSDRSTTTGEPKQAAAFTVYPDLSLSVAAISDGAYAARLVQEVGREFGQFKIGDSARIVEVGDASSGRAVTVPIVTGYRLRIPAAQRKLTGDLNVLFDQARAAGGDKSTHLLYTLEHSNPICTPRSGIAVLSDGVESSGDYSAADALNAGKPVNLPPPPGPYLKGCSVIILGIGLSGTGANGSAQALPAQAMRSLENGWRTYLRSAGATDIRFQSIL